MNPGVWVVFRKELLETLRDRRTLMVMILVPVLLYPGLLVVTEQLALFGAQRLADEESPVGLVGEEWPELREWMEGREGLRLDPVAGVADAAPAIREDRVRAVVVVERAEGATPVLRILHDAADDRSRRALGLVGEALSQWRDTLVADELDAAGVSRQVLSPVMLADSSVALPSEVGGYALGRFLPMLLVFMTLLGTFYPAIDMAAGERERGTLEALLTVPVPPGVIVTGKFLAVAVVGITAAALNLGSLLLTFQTGLFRLGDPAALQVGITPWTLLVMALAILPLSVLFGALFLGIAVRARSFKEAQNTLTPVYMAALLPALLPLLPGIDLTPLLAAVPVAGTTLLIRDALAGGVDPVEGVVAVGSSMLWAWLGLRVAAGAFGSEGVVFGVAPASGDPDDEWSPEGGGPNAGGGSAPGGSLDGGAHDPAPGGAPSRPPVPLPRQVAFFIAGVAVLFFYGSRLLPGVLGESGILVAQVLFLLLPSILFLRAGGFPLGSALALRRPSGRDMTAGLMIILGGLPVAWVLAWLQGFVIPLPREFMEAMAELLRADEPGRLLWLLLLVAVTPAICEEVVFRGVLLQGTRRLGATTAILLNAAVFGAFHLSFETVYRFLPTFWLGLLLATVAWHTRSLWVVMVMHGVNNGIVVLLAALPWLRERMGDPEAAPPLLLIPVGVALLIGGMRLLRSSGDGPAPSPRGSPGGL